MRRRSSRPRAPTRSNARTTKRWTVGRAGGAMRRASPRHHPFRTWWRATSMCPRAARRTRPRAAAARKSPGPDLRHDAVAPDVDAVGFERPIRLLRRTDDIDVGARLELILAADHIGADHRIGTDDDLLLPVLIFDHDHLAVDTGHRRVHDRIPHRRVPPSPYPVTPAAAAPPTYQNPYLYRH